MAKSQKVYLVFKRAFDIVFSIVAILLCLAFLWWWVFPLNIIATKGHPIFIQKRIGKDKKIFNLLKIRSMKVDANPNLAPSKMTEEDQRNMDTWLGRFLRKSSIDETLQLFNILGGSMSFIGPRPGAAINEDELVVAREKFTPNAFMVKPGLTCLAILKMKREHDPNIKAKYDSEYVKNISFGLDTKIFFLTIFGIFTSNKGR